MYTFIKISHFYLTNQLLKNKMLKTFHDSSTDCFLEMVKWKVGCQTLRRIKGHGSSHDIGYDPKIKN